MEAFIGTVLGVGFTYPPAGWLFCNGQILPIQQSNTMFALLGTIYGGDGQNTFGIPDLRGRVIVGSQGQGPGLINIPQGSHAGTNNTTVIANGVANVALTQDNLPMHTHAATLSLSGLSATTNISVGTGTTGGAFVAQAGSTLTGTTSGTPASAGIYLPPTATPTSPVNLGGVTTTVTGTGSVVNSNTGNGTPLTVPVTTSATISNMQPYLGLNFIICQDGLYPSRN